VFKPPLKKKNEFLTRKTIDILVIGDNPGDKKVVVVSKKKRDKIIQRRSDDKMKL
jgi:hypothetical protein